MLMYFSFHFCFVLFLFTPLRLELIICILLINYPAFWLIFKVRYVPDDLPNLNARISVTNVLILREPKSVGGERKASLFLLPALSFYLWSVSVSGAHAHVCRVVGVMRVAWRFWMNDKADGRKGTVLVTDVSPPPRRKKPLTAPPHYRFFSSHGTCVFMNVHTYVCKYVYETMTQSKAFAN